MEQNKNNKKPASSKLLQVAKCLSATEHQSQECYLVLHTVPVKRNSHSWHCHRQERRIFENNIKHMVLFTFLDMAVLFSGDKFQAIYSLQFTCYVTRLVIFFSLTFFWIYLTV